MTFGEALIDLPSTKIGVGLADAPGFTRVAAGAPGNVAVAAHRLGLDTTFVTKVGADPFGDAIIQAFTRDGVDTSHIVKDPAARTGLAFVAIAADGEREFLFYFNPARDLALRTEEFDVRVLASARAFHYGSISLIAPPARGTTLKIAGLARREGALVSYDPNLRSGLWPDREKMRVWAELGFSEAQVTKVGADELRFLAPDAFNQDDAVRKLFDRHRLLRLVAVTDGGRGSVGYLRDVEPVRVPGFDIKPLDATGAGDAFMAGLLVSLLLMGDNIRDIFTTLHYHLSDALTYANACGALATTQVGATPDILSPATVETLMATQEREELAVAT